MNDATEQIKARLPLEDIIGEVVALKPAGRNRLKGLCPFHSESTPSFHVVVDKGFYHCFGCQSHGSVFDFVMRTQNLDFRSALEQLAQRAGVELPKLTKNESRKRNFYEINDLAQSFFVARLAESDAARAYLEQRGFTAETIQAWGIGYAPAGWKNFVQHANTAGMELEILERAGIVRSKEGRYYDLFRDRITIPILDLYGRVVGFSARTPGDDEPKYVNTPEIDIFKKGGILFGMNRAKASIKSAAILVEGQLDVIALHQAGYLHAVGAQSATLTEPQITALERLGVTQLYMAFDADAAGQRATIAGCDAVARRFAVRIVELPKKDPAETVRDDPHAFRIALERAVTEERYRFDKACEGLDLSRAWAGHRHSSAFALRCGMYASPSIRLRTNSVDLSLLILNLTGTSYTAGQRLRSSARYR